MKNYFLVCAVKSIDEGRPDEFLNKVKETVKEKLHPVLTRDSKAFVFDDCVVVKVWCGVSGQRARRVLSKAFPNQEVSVKEIAKSGTETVFGDGSVFCGPFYTVEFGFLDELDDTTVFVSRDFSKAGRFYKEKSTENLKKDFDRDGIRWEPPVYKDEDFGHFFSYAVQAGVSRIGCVDFRLLRVSDI